MTEPNIIIIGLGGVGSILSGHLCRFLNFSDDLPKNVLLVDGDEYESKNFERQEFTRIGNKADITSYQMPKSQIAEELIQIQIKLGENYAGYFQTSAKTGDQVEMAFRDLIQIISKQILSQASYQDLFQDADDFSDIIEVPPPPELGGVTFPPP